GVAAVQKVAKTHDRQGEHQLPHTVDQHPVAAGLTVLWVIEDEGEVRRSAPLGHDRGLGRLLPERCDHLPRYDRHRRRRWVTKVRLLAEALADEPRTRRGRLRAVLEHHVVPCQLARVAPYPAPHMIGTPTPTRQRRSAPLTDRRPLLGSAPRLRSASLL